ncbi:unnamed protein product [Paramecium pentaurelia]|uniref:Cyclic nucleotide-binding domain-containing protein n=1 Tax=Paramecium pentaurelia TaxID=43138 RepID=A0A8S1Y3U4_9CILI|nr:unnamed protein product [Paramecium pentaurelia]
MFHRQYIEQSHNQSFQVLESKEYRFLGDKLVLSENSDEEEIKEQKKEFKVLQKTRKKLNWRKSIGLLLVQRRSSAMSYVDFNWEKFQLRLRGLLKKIIKGCTIEKPYILSPDGSIKMMWDLLCLGLVMYEMISIPLQISFEIDVSVEFSRVSTGIFAFDILLNFNTGIFEDGLLKMNRNAIIKDYVQFWFWVDFTTTFPYDIILDESSHFIQSAKLLRLLKFLRFIKILKLLRLAKLKKIMDKFNEILQLNSILAAILTFGKLFLFVLFFAHLLGCIFHFTAQQEDKNNQWLGDLYNADWYIRYINSLYWGVTTMTTVGYGDISPLNPTERFLGIFLLLIACGGFAFTMNSIGFALQKISEKSSQTKDKLSQVNKYMKKAKIPETLQNKIRKYLEYVWDRNGGVVLQQITGALSVDLSKELQEQVNGKLFGYLDIFWSNHSYDFLVLQVMPIMKEKVFCPQEIIFDESEQESYDIFMIQSGEVDIYFQKTNITVDKKGKNEFFGEISFYSAHKRTASAKSVDFSNIFRINSSDFLKLARSHSNDVQTYFKIRHKIVFDKDYSAINIRCYMCQMDDHIARDCPSLHFQVQASHYLAFLQQVKHVQQSSFVRKDRLDFNARFHNNLISRIQGKFIKTEKKIQYYQENKSHMLISIEQLEVQSIKTEEDDYNAINQINRLDNFDRRFKQSVRLKHRKNDNKNENNGHKTEFIGRKIRNTNRVTTIIRRDPMGKLTISCGSEDDQIDKVALERINKYLEDFHKKISLSRKKEWKEFSSIPNFEKYHEYHIYYPESNISKIIPQYQKQKAKIMTDVSLNSQTFGEEELISYAQYYCYDLEAVDISKFFNKTQNRNMLNYEEQRISRLDRRMKKMQNYIRKPARIKTAVLVLKAVKKFSKSLKNIPVL